MIIRISISKYFLTIFLILGFVFVTEAQNQTNASIKSDTSAKVPPAKYDTTRGQKLKKFKTESTSLFRKSFGIDTLAKNDIPKVAFFRSVLFPGWGQITNKQYIKLPIVYISAGVGAYFIYTNNKKYREFEGYLLEMKANGTTEMLINGFGPYSNTQINTGARQYRRWKQGTVIGYSVGWLLFAIEANVAAHMKSFDVSDNISLNLKPNLNYIGDGIGIKLSFNYK